MAKLSFTPQSGSVEQSKAIKFVLSDLPRESVRVSFENATNGSLIKISGNDYVENNKRTVIEGEMDILIPEYSSHACISVYATIQTKQKDEWKTHSIVPTFYSISEEEKTYDGEVMLSSQFIGPTEFAEIQIKDKPDSRYVVSINDKQFTVLTSGEGYGTYSFVGSDILERDPKVLFKYPIHVRTQEDDFSEKKFTGQYIHVMPQAMEMMADCDPFSLTDSCLPSLQEASPLITEFQIGPNFPDPVDDADTDPDSCSEVSLISSGPCRIDNYSMTLMPNNAVVYAYVGRDEGEQNNTVRLGYDTTSSSKRSLPLRYGVVLPDNDRILLLVEEDVWKKIVDTTNWQISLRHPDFNFATYEIDELLAPDPYQDSYRISLIPKSGDTTVISYFCMPFVAFDSSSGKTAKIGGLPESLPIITDIYGTELSVANVTIASSRYMSHAGSASYIYVIAEASTKQSHQLFMYSMKVQSADSETYTDSETYGWKQLTFGGENKNPKAICDDAGNLHVFWESSRANSASQVYYGVLGPQANSLFNAAFSSSLDKQIQAIEESSSSFVYDYTIGREFEGPTDYVITKLCPGLESYNRWMKYENEGGVATVVSDSNIRIIGNASNDHAMAFTSFDQDITGSDFTGLWSQLAFEVGFNLSDNMAPNVLTDDDISDLFLSWKSNYVIVGGPEYNNQNIYKQDNNRFILGKTDRYFDRFIPLIGSYKNIQLDSLFSNCQSDSYSSFSVVGSGCNSTLKHFMLGIMPEKVRFRATNTDTFQEYCDRVGGSISDCVDEYLGDTDTIHYTGRYKLCILINADGRYFGGQERRGYTLSREIGKPFTLTNSPRFNIAVHYRKLFQEDNNIWAGASADSTHINSPRAMGSIIVAKGGEPVFSESFLVDMTDGRRKFDIGIGLPDSGQYITREFLPYQTIIYEDLGIDFTFSDVEIGAPAWTTDSQSVVLPSDIKIMEDVWEPDTTSEIFPRSFAEEQGWLNMGMEKMQFFPQVPITFEGVNKGVNVAIGPICNDIHIAWQTNRRGYWDIAYSSSSDRAMPFRFDTMITRTESNSLMPSIAVDGNGRRIITWHDNRDGQYQIYAAKGDAGDVTCNFDDCELFSGIRIRGAPNYFDPEEKEDVCKVEFTLCNEPCEAYFELQLLDICSTLAWCDPVTCASARTSPGEGRGWTPPLPDPDDAHVVLKTHDTGSAPICNNQPGYFSTVLCTPKGYNRRVQCSRLFVYKCATHNGNMYTFMPESKVILKTGWVQNGDAPDATSGPFYSNGPGSGTLLNEKPYWFSECGIGGWQTTSSFFSSMLEGSNDESEDIREMIYNAAETYLGSDLPAQGDRHTIIMHLLFHRYAGQSDSDSRVQLARIYTFDCPELDV